MKKPLKMYLDQYGYKWFARTRKELVEQISPYGESPRVSIMYQDKKNGKTVRVGYIVSDHWCTAYLPDEQLVS